jgi:hypothetical protein
MTDGGTLFRNCRQSDDVSLFYPTLTLPDFGEGTACASASSIKSVALVPRAADTGVLPSHAGGARGGLSQKCTPLPSFTGDALGVEPLVRLKSAVPTPLAEGGKGLYRQILDFADR